MTAAASPAVRPCPQCGTLCAVEHHYCPGCGFPVGTLGPVSDDKFVGRTLPGGYHILDLLAVGGMGRVYRAEQSVLGRTVAVKIIHPHLLADENSAVRFLTEARAASQLNHPNSIAIYDFGRTDDGQPYIVMEYLRGKDLARVAYEDGPLGFERLCDVLQQVLAALTEAHDLGIVHRDLKPENVMLEPLRRGGDFVKVLDFGLAKLRADVGPTNVTSPGIVCGTPDYMAPEQGRGDAIDGRTDLYAVGVMLFQLLTGKLPFEADSPTQVVMMHLSIPVPDPRQVANRRLPQALVDVTLKALEKDANRRYQDAAEFSEALRGAIATISSAPPLRQSALPAQPSPNLTPVPELATCRTCSNLVPRAKFCGECGAPMTQSSLSRISALGITQTHTAIPRFPLPLVGRDEDIAWLEERRRRALGGATVGARIVGDAGSGKTRVMEEFLAQAEANGDLVVRVGPDPWWADAACWALRRAIMELSSAGDLDTGSALRANRDAMRGLEEVVRGQVSRDSHYSALERRFAYAEALRWSVDAAAMAVSSKLVIIAVDELHRVDAASRAAFADLLGEPMNASLLLVATHAPGFDAAWGAEHAARVLGGLPPPTVSRLLATSRSGERLGVSLDESGRGVLPLYLDQLLRFSLEAGEDPPARLADLIGVRLDMLGTDARRVLQSLAVLGDEMPVDALSLMLPAAERDTARVEAHLTELAQAGFVTRRADVVSTGHPLLHDIVLAGIPAAVKRQLHDRALVVCSQRNSPLEAQALHAFHAQDSFQALLLLEQVADRSNLRGDAEAEVLALRRCLELARLEISRGELEDPLQAVLIFGRKLGSALTRSGNYGDAEGVLREALDVAGPSGPERARVLGALAQVAHGRARKSEALGFIDQAIKAARDSGATELVGTLSTTRRSWAS